MELLAVRHQISLAVQPERSAPQGFIRGADGSLRVEESWI